MKHISSVTAAALLAMLAASNLAAQATSTGTVRTDIPVVDAPFNFAEGIRGPSMAQSLAVTNGFYEVAHPAISSLFGSHTRLGGTAIFFFDLFGSVIPPGDAWVHEEYHRAVLSHRGVSSFDDTYHFDLTAETINVSHVLDADLIRMKAEHPVDYVRAAAAGIEGENLMIEGLEKNRFFQDSRAKNVALYWLTKINSAGYVWSGITLSTDTLVDDANREEGADVAKRDWIGHDFTGWVHDLFRPTEPYTARGVHPSGVGINRYIRASDLSPEEHDFLNREGELQLINFIDPNLFGFTGFSVQNPLTGRDARMMVTGSAYLTSFGHSVDMNLFLRDDAMNLFVVLHRYTNGARSFPGVEAQLLDKPVTIAGMNVAVSPRVALWLQPQDQQFRTATKQPGGLVSLRVRQASAARVTSFLEVEAKTEGWVAGNVHLEPNVSVRIGGSVRAN